MNLYSFIVAILMGVFGLIVGFFFGHASGISKGAEGAAAIAVSAHQSFFGFLEVLEATMNSDIEDTDPVKELMIGNLEAYPSARIFLSVHPYNQEYRENIRKMDRETIEDVVGRLKQNIPQIIFKPQNKPVEAR